MSRGSDADVDDSRVGSDADVSVLSRTADIEVAITSLSEDASSVDDSPGVTEPEAAPVITVDAMETATLVAVPANDDSTSTAFSGTSIF